MYQIIGSKIFTFFFTMHISYETIVFCKNFFFCIFYLCKRMQFKINNISLQCIVDIQTKDFYMCNCYFGLGLLSKRGKVEMTD